jgi:hypothetical protein
MGVVKMATKKTAKEVVLSGEEVAEKTAVGEGPVDTRLEVQDSYIGSSSAFNPPPVRDEDGNID